MVAVFADYRDQERGGITTHTTHTHILRAISLTVASIDVRAWANAAGLNRKSGVSRRRSMPGNFPRRLIYFRLAARGIEIGNLRGGCGVPLWA